MEHLPFDNKRITFAATILRKAGFIMPEDAATYEQRESIAERTVLDIIPLAETAEVADEKEQSTNLNKARRHRKFLLPYYENASDGELKEVQKDNNWSTGQRPDTVAKKGLDFYVRMSRLPRLDGVKLSPEAAQSQQVFRTRTLLEQQPEELLDLDQTLRELGTTPDRLPRPYAQGLLIAFDKVHSTADSKVIANTVSLALEDVLKRHKYHYGDLNSILRRFGEFYLTALETVDDEPDFERITKYAWQMAAKNLLDDGSVLPLFESEIARRIATMYPSPVKRA